MTSFFFFFYSPHLSFCNLRLPRFSFCKCIIQHWKCEHECVSLKHFPGLCSSTESPVHLCGFYNNVLLLFCVNICYRAGSAFFLPPTFLLPCARVRPRAARGAWFDWNHSKRYCRLRQRRWVEFARRCPRGWRGGSTWRHCSAYPGGGPCSPSPASSLAGPERTVPRLRARVLCGWRFLGWGMGSQFPSSPFAPRQGWRSQALPPCASSAEGWLAKWRWVKGLILGSQASRSRTGERALPTLPTNLLIPAQAPAACEILWGRDEAAMVSGEALGERAGLAAISFS